MEAGKLGSPRDRIIFMNRTDRTLFHRKTLDNAVGGYVFPPSLVDKHEKIQKWIAALASGTI